MDYKFECIHCGQRMSATDDLFGTKSVCPSCNRPFVIPFPNSTRQPAKRMSEEVIYTDQNVSVTTSRLIISETTYALRNITSVKTTVEPAKRGCATILVIVGPLILFGSIVNEGGANFIGGLMIFLILVGAGILWFIASKNVYYVSIASSSGEAKALASKDRSYIKKVVDAINEAIVRYN